MTLHFAQVALALLVGGAAVLLIAGLVLETAHHKDRHRLLFPESPEPLPERKADDVPLLAEDAPADAFKDVIPFPHSRGDEGDLERRARSNGEETRDPDRKERRKKRKKEKRNGKDRSRKSRRTELGETREV